MSTKGVYTALSGAIAQSQRLDTISNNLANVNTPGFKKDTQVFKEYLTAFEKPSDVITVPKIPSSIESFYDNQAGDRGYVDGSGTYTDHSQGFIKATGNKFDLAIEGGGFFEVSTPQGVRYSRSGSFTVDGQGRLTTKQGFPVLARGQGEAQSRSLQINGTNVNIASSGEIFVDNQSVGFISVVDFGEKQALQKAGMNLFSLKETFDPQLRTVLEPKLHQGFLENSNVNVIQEMTDMIAATRVFDSTQKGIKAYDSMEELVNTIPKF